MVLQNSEMPGLGSPMPAFDLMDVRTKARVRSGDLLGGKGLLVMFICRHCPFVVHVEEELARLVRDRGAEIAIVAISANDPERHPEDAPEGLREQARRIGLDCPYLFDETQEVARAFRAACTPDFFLYDGAGRLFYRGQLDDARPGKDIPCDGRDLRAAIDALVAGEAAPTGQKPSIGCNVKWKPGAEPDYFKP